MAVLGLVIIGLMGLFILCSLIRHLTTGIVTLLGNSLHKLLFVFILHNVFVYVCSLVHLIEKLHPESECMQHWE